MELLKEMRKKGFDVLEHRVKVQYRVFKDNSGAIERAVVHKWRPHTKNLVMILYHFRSYVNYGEISVHKIDTSLQPADVLTGPLDIHHGMVDTHVPLHTYHCTYHYIIG